MEHYDFDDYEPDELTPVEAFRGLREGDVIVLSDVEWRVRRTRTIRSRGPYIGEVRLQGEHRIGDVPLAECVDYRAESSPQPKPGLPFRVMNAEGEWGYEDEEAGLFGLVSMSERPEEYRPVDGTRYYDALLEDYFDVLDVDEYEVTVEYRSEDIVIDTIPRLVFPLRREWMEYQPVNDE